MTFEIENAHERFRQATRALLLQQEAAFLQSIKELVRKGILRAEFEDTELVADPLDPFNFQLRSGVRIVALEAEYIKKLELRILDLEARLQNARLALGEE